MADDLRQFSAEHGLAEAAVWPFLVALDEVLANTLIHGFQGPGEGHIEIEFELSDGVLAVRVLDDAPPFNPLEAPTPDLDGALEDRALGGLGIHLVRNLMDDVAYDRPNGRNRLQLTKRVG